MRGSSNAPKIVHSNKNLLDNWDFTNPVNQRGQSLYSSAGYTIDRWKIAEQSKITVNSDSISVKGRMYQMLEEFAALGGETVTLSLLYTNNTNSTEGRINVLNGSTWLSENVNIKANVFKNIISTTFTVPNTLSEFAVNFISENATIKLHAYKLELGETSTLKNDVLGVSYAEELKKCQRYYQVIPDIVFTGVRYINGDVRCNSISLQNMRAAPTVIFESTRDDTNGKGIRFIGYGLNAESYINLILKKEDVMIMIVDNQVRMFWATTILSNDGSAVVTPTEIMSFGTNPLTLKISADL